MYILCWIGLVFFAMIGLCAFVLSLIRILTEHGDENAYLIVIPKVDADNAERSIRAAIRRINEIGTGRVLCLCDENDEEAADICRRMQSECAFLEIVNQEELCSRLALRQ